MPYKDPQRKKEWEQRHRHERVGRRRELRRIEAVQPVIESTVSGEFSFPWHLLAGGGLLTLYNPALGLGAGSLVLAIAALRKKSWIWWVIGALACEKAGIEGVTWHTLRHTFASRLLAQGVDIMTVKELLGHSTVVVTMRYLHPNLDAKVAALSQLGGDCYNPATPCTKMQQSKPKVSQIGR